MAINSTQKAQVIIGALKGSGVNLTTSQVSKLTGSIATLYAKGKSDDYIAAYVLKKLYVKAQLNKLIKAHDPRVGVVDTDGNGKFSAAEKKAFFAHVASDLVAEINKYAPTTLTQDKTSITEGVDSITFTVTGTPGVTLNWAVDANHVADVNTASGTVTLGTAGTAVFTVAAKADGLTEGNEQINVSLTNDAGVVLGSSAPTTIVDKTVPPPPPPENFFTLTEVIAEPGTPAIPDSTVVYWGYNPHNHSETDGVDNTAGGNTNNETNEGPQDKGIPVAALVEFLTTITGLDLAELGLIDADGQDPFQNVTSLTLSNPISPNSNPSNSGNADDEGVIDQSTSLRITFADGTFLNAEVALGDKYFEFLNNLLFDAEGNSRLYEVEVPGTSGTGPLLAPIVLTPSQNNGGTIETGVTSVGDDTIVAGRLELLHQAYIDGGAGYNTLEVDAKGTYAQPLTLKNIQEVRVNDLPNFYTTYYGDPTADGNLDNTQFTDTTLDFPNPIGTGSDNSWLDLSRATDIERLVVTDSGYGAAPGYDAGFGDGNGLTGYSEDDGYSGNLSIVGVRNGATLRLEGSFISGNTTIQYGQGQTGTLNVELALGDVTQDINILQNASVLNIDSQGVENHMHSFFAGGSISRLLVKGTGVFAVDEDLVSSFNAGRPAIIDASANTGGLDVTLNGHYKVTVKGTQADDEIISNGTTQPYDGYQNPEVNDNNDALVSQGIVVIDAGNGNNDIQADLRTTATITTGTGNDNISAQAGYDVTIVAGDGKNLVNTNGSQTVDITTGAGNDTISSIDGQSVTIVAGDGNNVITADNNFGSGYFGTAIINITTGAGNDTISAVRAGSVTIDAGNGINSITASANEINVTTGSGNDKVYLSGMDISFDQGDAGEGGGFFHQSGGFNDWNDDNYGVNPHFVDNWSPGSLVTLDLGAGSNTVTLGRDIDLFGSSAADVEYGLTALEGSFIRSAGTVNLFVENNSDLTEADLTDANISSVVLKQELRITADQFSDIGASAFSVKFDEEGATEDLYIVVNEDTTLGNLVNLAQLNTNVRLHFEIHNGAELTLTAEQLHKYVAWHGIDSTDGLNGKVKIIDAGQNFDPFDNGDNYQVIDGGSLTGNFDFSTDVTIIRSLDGGFERPAPQPSTDTLLLDSNVDAVIETAINSEVATLKIIGDHDIVFEHSVNLGRDNDAGTLADGTKGDLATWDDPATADHTIVPESDNFTIDFSALNGNVVDLTIANFQDVKEIKGNGSATREVRLDVELTDGSTVGAEGVGKGLKSSGVQTYVVTSIGDDSVGEDSDASSATIFVCDLTKGLKVLGLQGNYNDTINFKQVNWGTNFLLEAGGNAKADGNPSYANIGSLHAEYFWTGSAPYANSVVNINNQGVALSRPINVAGIDIDYADSIAINAADGDVIIQSLGGNEVDHLTFVSANDITVRDLTGAAAAPDSLDASAVAGTFTLDISNWHDVDLSGAVVSGLDAVIFSGTNGDLTLTTEQLLALGTANITTTEDASNSDLHVTEYAGQAIDFTAIDVTDVQDITFADVDGTIVVNSGAVFGNGVTAVDSLTILAETSDTTVEISAAQFNQLDGAGTVNGDTEVSAATGDHFEATLVLTNLAADVELDLSDVEAAGDEGVSVVIRAENVVATDDFSVTGHSATLEVVGNVNLSAGDIAAVNSVELTAGSVLTLTAAQVAAIGTADVNDDGVADAWSGLAGATLHITDLSTQALDLDAIEAAGINIGTLTLLDSNGEITLNAATTLGGADAIVTPTKDINDPVDHHEPTVLNLTADQFNQLAGAGTISGDATVNITDLVNNFDSDGKDGPDVAVIDVSGVTAPHGTLTLGEQTVTLANSSTVAGFEIKLGGGQMIQFTTQAQADGQEVTETVPGTTTAIAWLFDTSTGVIDTSKYDSGINTLYILEDLVDGKNEESLWTTLADSIVVEKTNVAGIPDVLISFDRVNTFEALTAIAGVSYDDQDEFETVRDLTINLEGNTNIGNVGIGDTVGEGNFQSLTINSYEDRSTLGADDNGFDFTPNRVGNISLNAGTSDELLHVTLNTYGDVDNVIGTGDDAQGFRDAVNVNGPEAERDGLALEVGTITFAANETSTASLTLTGAEDISVAGVNISDADVNLLVIDASTHTGDLDIANIHPTGGDAASNDMATFDHIYVVDGYTAPAASFGTLGNNLLVVTGGNNDLSAATSSDIDQVHFTGNGTLTLTADQVQAISQADGPDADNAADAWSALAGLNVTLNIVGLDGANVLDLNAIANAGINIGNITLADGTVTLNPATTLGGADSIIIPADGVLNLTAAQFEQLAGNGTITTTGVNGTVDHRGVVNITDLTDAEGSINLSDVTAKNGTIFLSDASIANGGTDVTLTAAANLNHFSVTLNDVDSSATTDNQLAGQTIRFATAGQAERQIIVTGEDNNDGGDWNADNDAENDLLVDYYERDTNVVWLFNSISGTTNANKIDTSKYDIGLGRVWVNDELVNGKNIEDIFSSPSAVQPNPTEGVVNLNSTTIIRVVNTANLDTLPPDNIGVSRTVEVEAFTDLPGGLVFNNPDKLVGVQNLTLDLGGDVTIGNIAIDDIVATSISNDNEFGTLVINSLLADNPDHYLLPESWQPGVNPLPTDANVLGNISSGATRDELARVTINASGVGLKTGTITFSDDGGLTPANPLDDDQTAVLRVTGDKNVNIQSVNTADADITTLNVITTGYTGTLTAPGASPGFALDNTQSLFFDNNNVADNLGTGGINEGGTITLGSAAHAGVAGNELSLIDARNFDGTLNLGVLSQLDSTDDDLNSDGDFADAGENRAFTFTSGDGITTATLAASEGRTPTLNAGSEWQFQYTNADQGSYLKITPSTVFQSGATLRLIDVPVQIEGAVDLTVLVDNPAIPGLEGLFIGDTVSGTTSIQVLAGSTLTLTVDQVLALGVANVIINGAGTLKVIGTHAGDFTLGGNIETVTVDITGVTVTAPDTDVDLLLHGADHDNKVATGLVGQTVLGSGVVDTITTGDGVNDNITGKAGNDTLTGGTGNDTYNVDAGTDTVNGLATGDVLVVSSGATANASVAGAFVATAATVNNGTANLSNIGTGDVTINVAAATGANGFNLTGSADAALGADILIGSSKADIINGGNSTQTTAAAADTLRGNGGADTFVFNIASTTPAVFTHDLPAPKHIEAIDREIVTVTADGADSGDEKITVNYVINDIANSFVIQDTVGNNIDFSNGANLAALIAARLESVAGVTASVDAGNPLQVNAVADNGGGLAITTLVEGTKTTLAAAVTNGVDVPEHDTIQVSFAPGFTSASAGETYHLTVKLASGLMIVADGDDGFVATGGETAAQIAIALANAFNTVAPINTVLATANPDGTITLDDEVANDGGFTIESVGGTGSFGGSGASANLNIPGFSLATADIIVDYEKGIDKIDLNLQAGVDGGNYAHHAAYADFTGAFTAANAALNKTVQYFYTASTADNTGLLFFDANLDGNADGVIKLTGIIDDTHFAASDIIA